MPLDIEIATPSLLNLVQSALQQGFNTTCFPSFPPYYIDHLNVDTGSAALTQSGALQFSFPVDMFVVSQTSLVANANQDPPEASKPLGQAAVVLALTVSGTTLTLACTSVDLPAAVTALLGTTLAAAVSSQIQTQIGTVGSADLTPVFTLLGLPSPTSSAIAESGPNVFVRFDPSGPPVDHLQSGQEWCLFIDSATVVSLVMGQVNGMIGKLSSKFPLLTSHTTTASWAPVGTLPHINAVVNGKVSVPDPLSGDVTMTLGIDFSLQHLLPLGANLLEFVTWNFSISTGVPPLDSAFESTADTTINKLIISGTIITGATWLGPNLFSIAESLPAITLGPATLAYGSVTGLAEGMVLGGAVAGIPTPDTKILGIDVTQFPIDFLLIGYCAGGTPPATLTTVSVTASVFYTDAAELCSVSVISPSTTSFDITPYLAMSPPAPAVTSSGSISITLNGIAALLLANANQPIELLLQTTRGVRIINFGTPPAPAFNDQNNVTNLIVEVIDNCPVAVDPWFLEFHAFNPRWAPYPGPDWTTRLEEVAAFQSSLIRVNGLEAGELLLFSQAADAGLTAVSAGPSGAAVTPALLVFRSDDEQAALMRLNRTALPAPSVSSAIFRRVAVLSTPGAISHQLSGTGEQATITTIFAGERTVTTLVDVLGIVRQVGNQPNVAGAAAEKRNLPAGTTQASSLSVFQIPGLIKILSVPGFEQGPIAVAQVSNGSYLVLAREATGSIRVAGLTPRWPDMPPVSGGWAISSSVGNRVAVFKVQDASVRCSCGPQEVNRRRALSTETGQRNR